MGVNIVCGAWLSVAKIMRHYYQRCTVGNLEAGVCMPQGMDVNVGEVVPLDELVEPVRQAVREERVSILPRKYAVVSVCPCITHDLPLIVLPALILQKKKYGRLRNLQRSGAGSAFWFVDIAPLAGDIVPSLANVKQIVVDIYIDPAQAQNLSAAQTREQIKGDDCSPVDRLILQQFK